MGRLKLIWEVFSRKRFLEAQWPSKVSDSESRYSTLDSNLDNTKRNAAVFRQRQITKRRESYENKYSFTFHASSLTSASLPIVPLTYK